MTPSRSAGVGTGPYTPGNGAPVYNRPHGRDEHPQQYPKHQAGEPFAKHCGKQSMGEITFFKTDVM